MNSPAVTTANAGVATGTPTGPATPANVGPIDAGQTGGNTLVPGVKGTTYIGVGVSFYFNS